MPIVLLSASLCCCVSPPLSLRPVGVANVSELLGWLMRCKNSTETFSSCPSFNARQAAGRGTRGLLPTRSSSYGSPQVEIVVCRPPCCGERLRTQSKFSKTDPGRGLQYSGQMNFSLRLSMYPLCSHAYARKKKMSYASWVLVITV